MPNAATLLVQADLAACRARRAELRDALRAFVDPNNAPFITECDAAAIRIMDNARAVLAKGAPR